VFDIQMNRKHSNNPQKPPFCAGFGGGKNTGFIKHCFGTAFKRKFSNEMRGPEKPPDLLGFLTWKLTGFSNPHDYSER
jgi:hypothetical protein